MAVIVNLGKGTQDTAEPAPGYPAEVLEAGWVPELEQIAQMLGARPRPSQERHQEDPQWSEAASA